jgi:hypothetical protein
LFVASSDALAQELSVTQAVICKAVADRSPLDTGDRFPIGTERVFCFTQVDGAAGDAQITHHWYYQGRLMASVVLPVKSTPWRTWSSKSLRPDWTGEWLVEVLDNAGRPLESLTFSID